MNGKDREIVDTKKNSSFWKLNQQTFRELLTFVDFADDKLNIAFAEINFARDRDILIEKLIADTNCQDIQFVVLDFSDPNLRFFRDELVKALKKPKITPNKKLILLITGLEKSIGIVDEYPPVLVDLNYVRDDFRISLPHPIIFFLPDYALTRLAKYAPDFWAWGRKVFYFKSVKSSLEITRDTTIFVENAKSLNLPEKQARIDLLQRLLSEYKTAHKSEKKPNLQTIINLHNELGNAYHFLGDYQRAIEFHQQSLKIAQNTEDCYGEANSLNNLGNAYNSLGEYQQAINYHQQSLAIQRKIGDRNDEANSLNNLGNVYNSLGEYQQAIDFYQQSLAIKQQIGDRNGGANSLGNLGNAYDSMGEYQQAIDFQQQSLAIKQQIGDLYGECASLNNLGNVYNSLGEYQRAIGFYQQSLAIAQQIGDRKLKSTSLMGLGNACSYLGEYQQAIGFYQQSLAIAQQIGDRHGEAASLGNLGIAYYSLGEYQQAIDYHQKSLAIQQQICDRHGEANTWFNLGISWENLQQISEAKTAYENAQKLYQAMELDREVENCNKAIQDLENSD